MVNWRHLLFLLLTLAAPGSILAARVKVAAQMDASRTAEHRRMEGKITVYHPISDKVDIDSFELEKKPLKVELISERKIAADDIRNDTNLDFDSIVSVYRFQLPGKAKGLYILPSIAVVVGDKKYRSVATTYEVTAPTVTSDLELEAIVDGEQPFYPGQHFVVKYRIYYNKNIELIEEHLPLLDVEGLQKVGEKEVTDSQTETYTVQEISQEVRAIDPGTYTFGPSVLEGVSYVEEGGGKRTYDRQRLRAIAPAISFEVAAFPEEGRPASFTGAVGQYTMKTRLLTHAKIKMGEKAEVGVRITGGPDIDLVTMPDLACQPGFSGFFQIGDYPPFEQRDQLSKEFILELRPLSANINDIPSLEFSYFDPKVRQYKILQSDPIAIDVQALVSYKADTRLGKPEEQILRYGPKEDQNPGLIQDRASVSGVDWRIWLGKPSDVDIAGVYPLSSANLAKSPWTMGDIWIALGVFITFILAQVGWKRWRGINPTSPKVNTSADYLALAARFKTDPAKMSSLIEEAFLLLLVEKGWYARKVSRPELLTQEGVVGSVRSFLIDMAGKRYGGGQSFAPREVLRSARELYRTVRYG